MERPKNLKVGDKFVVAGDAWTANKGDIVTLSEDDKSECPYFTGSSKGEWKHYSQVAINFDNLRPCTLKFGGRIDGSTVTCHIGKSEGTAKYNPYDEKRGMPFTRCIGVAIAFARADGMSEADVGKLADALIHALDKPKAEEAPKQEDFKVGDKVKIRASILEGERYDGGCRVAGGMAEQRGHTYTISEKRTTNWGVRYSLKGSKWSWSNSMLELVEAAPVVPSVTIDGVRYVPEK